MHSQCRDGYPTITSDKSNTGTLEESLILVITRARHDLHNMSHPKLMSQPRQTTNVTLTVVQAINDDLLLYYGGH